MKTLAIISALVVSSAAHGIVKQITIDGNVYPGFDPRYDVAWGQKRIEWSFSSKASAQGLGPVANLTSPDMACRFNPIQPPALQAVARAGAEVVYDWTQYFHSHKGPILTFMGKVNSPTQDPTTVDFFKIHEVGYDPKTDRWANDVLVDNKMQWKLQIPSDIAPGDYIMRHEIVALHYATRPGVGPEFLISCANVKVLGDGTAKPTDTIRFPGGYKAEHPGLKVNVYYHENRYLTPGPKVYEGPRIPPKGNKPVVEDTGACSGVQCELYKATKAVGMAMHEATILNDDRANPGGGGCRWEPGADEKTAVCTPMNNGHEMVPTGTNAYGQFNLKPEKPRYDWNPLEGIDNPAIAGALPPKKSTQSAEAPSKKNLRAIKYEA